MCGEEGLECIMMGLSRVGFLIVFGLIDVGLGVNLVGMELEDE
jgi:hypothetical protein